MTEFGLTIRIDDRYNAEIGIPSTYMGKVCGLCGNYDGDPDNEYVSPNGDQVRISRIRLITVNKSRVYYLIIGAQF